MAMSQDDGRSIEEELTKDTDLKGDQPSGDDLKNGLDFGKKQQFIKVEERDDSQLGKSYVACEEIIEIPPKHSLPAGCISIDGKLVILPNLCEAGCMNGPNRDTDRYGVSRFLFETEVKQQLRPDVLGVIVGEHDFREAPQIGEFAYLVEWENNFGNDANLQRIWIPRSKIYKYNATSRLIPFVAPEVGGDYEPKCANGWTMSKFLSIEKDEIFSIGGQIMRVISVDQNELGAWLLKSHLSGDLVDGQSVDNSEFWRMEDFDRESKAMTSIRRVFIQNELSTKLAHARKTKKKSQNLIRQKKFKKKKISSISKLSTTEHQLNPNADGTDNEAMLTDEDGELDNSKWKLSDIFFNRQINQNDEGEAMGHLVEGKEIATSEACAAIPFTTDDTVILGAARKMQPGSDDSTDIVPQTPSASQIVRDDVDINRTLPQVQAAMHSTRSGVAHKRHSDTSPVFSPQPKLSYEELKERCHGLQSENVQLKARLEEEKGISATWESAYVGALREMHSDVNDLATENKKISCSAAKLEIAAASINEASVRWKKTEVDIKAMLEENRTTNEKTYAWIVPGNQPINPDVYNFTDGPRGSQPPMLENEVTVITEEKVQDFPQAIGKSDEATPTNQQPKERFIAKTCWTKFDFLNDPSYKESPYTEFAAVCKQRMFTKRLDHNKRRTYAYWYWLGLTDEELFGADGLKVKNALPNPPPESTPNMVREEDNGSKVIDGEIMDDSKLAQVKYKDYVKQNVEDQVMYMIENQRLKTGDHFSDKQRYLFFGCAQLALFLAKSRSISYMDTRKKLQKSMSRALYLMANALSADFYTRMWVCRKIPWIFAILDCITKRFPAIVTQMTTQEHNDLPIVLLTYLKKKCYKGKLLDINKGKGYLESSSSA